MLKAGPGIHRNGTELDLCEKMTGNLTINVLVWSPEVQNDVIATVAVRLCVSNIIFFFYNWAPICFVQKAEAVVNIINEVADNSDPIASLHLRRAEVVVTG